MLSITDHFKMFMDVVEIEKHQCFKLSKLPISEGGQVNFSCVAVLFTQWKFTLNAEKEDS